MILPDYHVGQCGECIIIVWIVNKIFLSSTVCDSSCLSRSVCHILPCRSEKVPTGYLLLEGKREGLSRCTPWSSLTWVLLLLLRLVFRFSVSKLSFFIGTDRSDRHARSSPLLNVAVLRWLSRCDNAICENLWVQRENEWKEIVCFYRRQFAVIVGSLLVRIVVFVNAKCNLSGKVTKKRVPVIAVNSTTMSLFCTVSWLRCYPRYFSWREVYSFVVPSLWWLSGSSPFIECMEGCLLCESLSQ